MDPQGNRTLLLDPDSVRTEYSYDELNRLETLTFQDGQEVTYEYFPDGLKRRVTNPNGTVSTYQYDAADRMTDITHTGPTGIVSAYRYTYDRNGNREQQIETNAGRTETTLYTYDLVNRLKTVAYPEKTVEYEYDPAGNRTRETTTGAEPSDKTFAYDAINRLLSIDSTVDAEDVAYQYDPNGNTTQKTKAGVTTTFHYDIRNQLGEVREGASILGRYGYDFDGRRILKIGNEGRRQYTYDQLSVITEADPANATVSKYDYGMDQLVRLDNRTEGRSFFHLDVLRSTVSLTDTAGADRQSIFYDAWGNERERLGASANHFTFTGHELDEETGLIHAKARFYDPDTGRFLNQDPLHGETDRPPSLHRYAYVEQNPLRFIDPTGLARLEIHDIRTLRKDLEHFRLEQSLVGEGKAVPTFPNVALVQLLQQFGNSAKAARTHLEGLLDAGASSYVFVVFEEDDFADKQLIPNDAFTKFFDETGAFAEIISDFRSRLQTRFEGAEPGSAIDISEIFFDAFAASSFVFEREREKVIHPPIPFRDPQGRGIDLEPTTLDRFISEFIQGSIAPLGFTAPFAGNGPPRVFRNRIRFFAGLEILGLTEFAKARLLRRGEELITLEIGGHGGSAFGRTGRIGGAFKDVPAKGGQVHHIPADSISPLSRRRGPAIRMDTADHVKTASWGNSRSAVQYRARQRELIECHRTPKSGH